MNRAVNPLRYPYNPRKSAIFLLPILGSNLARGGGGSYALSMTTPTALTAAPLKVAGAALALLGGIETLKEYETSQFRGREAAADIALQAARVAAQPEQCGGIKLTPAEATINSALKPCAKVALMQERQAFQNKLASARQSR